MKALFFSIIIVIILLGIVALNQFFTIKKAHSSFENYYTFRGCVQLLTKTNTDATCKLASGKVIKIVQYKGKWYLDKDLPVCYFTFCL